MKNFCATGIILKRSDVGEVDRIVTLFSREFGKITAVAKGARKLSSSKLSALEPGTLSKVYLITTQGLPILTQAQIVNDFSGAKKDLVSMRKVFEILEMLDSLLIDDDEQSAVFSHSLAILEHLSSGTVKSMIVREHLSSIIELLGFAEKEAIDFSKPLKDFVEEITQKKLRAYSYLSV